MLRPPNGRGDMDNDAEGALTYEVTTNANAVSANAVQSVVNVFLALRSNADSVFVGMQVDHLVRHPVLNPTLGRSVFRIAPACSKACRRKYRQQMLGS